MLDSPDGVPDMSPSPVKVYKLERKKPVKLAALLQKQIKEAHVNKSPRKGNKFVKS